MRVLAILQVLAAALIATSETAVGSAAEMSDVASSESWNPALQMQSNGQRFLRKRNDDDLDDFEGLNSEQRGLDPKKIGVINVLKGHVSKKQHLVNLLRANTGDDVLYKTNVDPIALRQAVESLKGRLSPAKYEKFVEMVRKYDAYWWKMATRFGI